ncbi:MAG: hypothetical protein LBP23_00595 [Treponema sp.]|nr:hypothetical protein [Treponema sp.]
MGGISIRLPEVPGGAGPGNRSAVGRAEASSLYYDFRFTGPDGQIQTKTLNPGDDRTFTVTAVPGTWQIEVTVFTGGDRLRGLGADTVVVSPGAVAAAEIKLTTLTAVTSYAELVTAIDNSVEDEILVITNDFLVTGTVYILNKAITLIADSEDRTLRRSPDFTGNLFLLSGQGRLTLGTGDQFAGILGGTLSINGSRDMVDATGYLVRVNNGGELVLRDRAELAENKLVSTGSACGSGVYVDAEGDFTMAGGTVSNNATTSSAASGSEIYGGGVGVSVVSDGSFTMEGGTIRDNTVSVSTGTDAYGGGVCILNSGGSFTMKTGAEISGNAAAYGGGVSVGVIAIGGTFNMEGGTISNNTATSQGGGVYVASVGSAHFYMKGDAQIVPGTGTGPTAVNGVSVNSTSRVNINGDLTAPLAANIVYPTAANSWVLTGTGTILTDGDPPNYTRFLINGQTDKIGPNGKILP